MADEADTETRQLPVLGIPPRNAAQWRGDILIALSLSALAFALYIVPAILYRPLFETPETRIAVVAREMLQNGNYVLPTIGGHARLTKPPLPYWLTALTAKIIGGDNYSERTMTRAVEIPTAVFAAMTVFILILYAGTIGGRTAGVMAGLIAGISVLTAHYAHLGYGDMILMATAGAAFCCAAWMLCVPHAGVLSAFGFGVALGLAVLTKGHVAAAFLALPLLLEIILRHSFNPRKVMLFAMGLAVAVCVAGPWFYLVQMQNSSAWAEMTTKAQDVWMKGSHDHTLFFYVYKLAGGLLPWTPVLLFAWPLYLLRKRLPTPETEPNPHQILNEHLRFFMLAAVLGFLALMLPRGGQDYYLLPLLPVVALSSALMLSRLKFPGGEAEEKLAWTQLVFGVVLGLFVLVLPLMKGQFGRPGDRFSLFAHQAIEMLGWGLIPLGLTIILVFLYCARQWVEGKVLHAGAALGVVGFGALMVWSFHWTTRQQQFPLARESAKLRERLNALGQNVTVYSAVRGESGPTLVFYLERPIEPLSTLKNNPNAKPATQRALVADRERLTELDLATYLPPPGEDFVVIPALEESIWQRISAKAVEPVE